MTSIGKDVVIDGIRLHIVEIATIKKYKRGYRFLVGYRIIDGGFISPVAHFWFDFPVDWTKINDEHTIEQVENIIKQKAKEVIDFYKRIKGKVKMIH